MYGESDVIRQRVAELRDQGADLRAMADHLVARTEAVGWTGRAADALAVRVRDRAARLRAVAARHETAADSLDTHLRAVDRLKEAIETAERGASRLAAGSASFSPPPPGHKAWLTVHLPGR